MLSNTCATTSAIVTRHVHSHAQIRHISFCCWADDNGQDGHIFLLLHNSCLKTRWAYPFVTHQVRKTELAN